MLFYTVSGGFIVTDCSVDDNINSYNIEPNTDNLGTKSVIYGLAFLETGNCIIIFDRIEGVPLTSLIPKTPSVYFSNEKRINCYEINH